MSKRLDNARVERESAAAEIHRIKEWADVHLAHDVVNPPTLFVLKKRLNTIETAYSNFRSAQRTIELADPAEIDADIVKVTEDDYLNISCTLEVKINDLETPTVRQETLPARTAPMQAPLMCMPQIKIDTFTGEDPTQWLSYYTKYKTMVHDKQWDISYKFDILRQSLAGEAARQIKDLEVTEANYQKAVDMLYTRWHNTKLLAFAHLEKIFSFPPINQATTDKLLSLVDTMRSNIRALESLGREVDGFNDILVYWVLKRLDPETKRKCDEMTSVREIPRLETLLTFIESIAQVLRLSSASTSSTNKFTNKGSTGKSFANTVKPEDKKPKQRNCALCNATDHQLTNCKAFKELSVSNRRDKIKSLGLCFNCLAYGHRVESCRSSFCRNCQSSHHTLLCQTQQQAGTQPTKPIRSSARDTLHVACGYPTVHYNLLPTAIVLVRNSQGDWIPGRALLDSGSQFNIITERFRQLLGIKRKRENVRVQTTGACYDNSFVTSFVMKSRVNDYTANLSALIQKRITNNQPNRELSTEFNIPKNIVLADPDFFKPNRIDLLLSVEITSEIYSIGSHALGSNLPTLQKTLLGWIVSGRVGEGQKVEGDCNFTGNSKQDDFDMEKFWSVESSDEQNDLQYTPTELRVEQHFLSTVRKTPDNYYEVCLPFVPNPPPLGESRQMAQRRLDSLMRRFSREPDLYRQYCDFMNEYLSLGHMTEVPKCDIHKVKYCIPHHAVLRPESSTTKLRVVFDASAKTSNGLCLNDILEKGPQLQQDLFSILCRFRTHKYAACADVEKMFRQVRVREEDTYWQCILWQGKVYRLTTVTYGTRPAPYLAVRALQQCAIDNESTFPSASVRALRDFYMDDLESGEDNESSVGELQIQMNAMLSTCNMRLRKWVINSERVMNQIPIDDRAECQVLDKDEFIKTLGMIYHPADDSFRVKINVDTKRRITKRTIQSDIARMFDPLGLLAPVVASSKMILQALWCLKLDWDESPPQTLFTAYDEIRQQLPLLHDFKITRCIKTFSNWYQLHGFCDASEKAYAANIYLLTQNENGEKSCRLICSKNRVAPLKRLTLARLELCGAELLSQLVTRVQKILCLEIQEIHYWTDSTTVLRWLERESRIFNTFVANRISRIQSSTSSGYWHYVPSQENPADYPTRGKLPVDFLQSVKFWLEGPDFLTQSEDFWPKIPYVDEDLPEIKRKIKSSGTVMAITGKANYDDLISSIDKRFHHSALSILRIFAHVGRFINACKERVRLRKADIRAKIPERNELCRTEMDKGLQLILRNIQLTSFVSDRNAVEHGLPLQGKFRFLRPFIDPDDDLIRVGGRLGKGDYPYFTKHPVVLPPTHLFTRTLMRHYHYRYLHCGQQALLAAIRQKYWPIGARQLANSVARSCNVCFYTRPKPTLPIMGHLPKEALSPGFRPFLNVAVDYASGLQIHQRGRGRRPIKAYVCVFVCMATHAIHLELTEELSTAAFIATIRRFIGRRGLCRRITCDNGTNFVGANNELQKLVQQLAKCEQKIAEELLEDVIEFKFSPPYSPHFNGLAEAGVKSMKTHLRRIAGNASLTYEEMNTLLIMIEAVLNSRPLTPLSEDPQDFESLTPAHFLVGGPLKSFPEPIDDQKVSLVSRYHRLRQLSQHFWKRWSKEYVIGRQQLLKWYNMKENLSVGDLVMIVDDQSKPFMWSIGRVSATYPDKEGVVRVAEVTTRTGVIKRAAHRLCPLPTQPKSNLSQ